MRGGYQRWARRSRHRRRLRASSTAWCRCASCRRSNAQVRRGQLLRQCGTPLLVSRGAYEPVAMLQPGRTAWRRCWTCSARCCRRRTRRTRRRAPRQPAWLQATIAAQHSRARLPQPCTSAMSARCSATGARADARLCLIACCFCGALSSVRVLAALPLCCARCRGGCCRAKCRCFFGLRGRGRVCRAGSRHGVVASRFDTCRLLVRVCSSAGAATLGRAGAVGRARRPGRRHGCAQARGRCGCMSAHVLQFTAPCLSHWARRTGLNKGPAV